MTELLYKETYEINGEKYEITCTKMKEDSSKEVEVVDTTSLSNDNEIGFESTVTDNVNDIMTISIEEIPDGMDICTWLSIINDFGIILKK